MIIRSGGHLISDGPALLYLFIYLFTVGIRRNDWSNVHKPVCKWLWQEAVYQRLFVLISEELELVYKWKEETKMKKKVLPGIKIQHCLFCSISHIDRLSKYTINPNLEAIYCILFFFTSLVFTIFICCWKRCVCVYVKNERESMFSNPNTASFA